VRFFAAVLLALCVSAQEAPPPSTTPAQPAPAPQAAPQAANIDDEFTRFVFFGKKFADLGDHASAYEQFAKADALKPDQPAVLYDMAVVLARAGRYSESQVKVDRYLQLFPSGEEKPNVARLQLDLEFQRELQKKRQADQEYADLFNRGKFLYARGELPEALKIFQQAGQLRAADPAAVYNEAVVYEKLGDYAKAIERFRRYAEVEGDLDRRGNIDERIYGLQHELDDMRTKIVCAFCGRKLPAGATWCERCWHGPYLVKSAVWNTRPCVEGASATRTTYFSDARFNSNDVLPCLWKNGSMLDSLRYTPSRQRAIQDARRAEGWTYAGDVLQGWSDKQGNQIHYTQGADYLERTTAAGGEILTYAAHADANAQGGGWVLDRESLVVDAQRYVNHYTYDAAGRIAQQQTEYQNTAACNHLITVTADYTYSADDLMSVTFNGGYEGFPAEGAPKTQWQATVTYDYDDKARVSKEELAVTSFTKTYQQKPQGALRDDISRVFTGMRVKKPLDTLQRSGDLCATSGNLLLSNPIDLRPFYAMSPNLAIALQNGVTRAVVTFTYPDSFGMKK
jgi:tetratricopeptide (TPR) repeat protein